MCWLDLIKNIFEILFYGSGIIVAFWGLTLWHRELKGKAHFQTARNILVSTYKVRDAINSCQSSFMLSSDFENRKTNKEETVDVKNINDSYYAFANRFNKVYDERAILYNYYVEAEAYFGKESIKPLDKLFNVIHKLRIAIELYHQYKLQNVGEEKMMQQFFNILYGITNYKSDKKEDKAYLDDDNFAKELDEAISEIEKYFKKMIR